MTPPIYCEHRVPLPDGYFECLRFGRIWRDSGAECRRCQRDGTPDLAEWRRRHIDAEEDNRGA